MFKSVVQGVQLAALAVAAFTVVMLFANEPTDVTPVVADGGDVSGAAEGARIYAVECARCHGATGGGGFAPALTGIEDRLTVEEQVAVLHAGPGAMPSFTDTLTAEEIDLVVAYTRESL